MSDHHHTSAKKSQSAQSQVGLAQGMAFSVADTVLAPIVQQQREMLSFATMRLEKDREAFAQMIAAKDFVDAVDVQSRWAWDCLSDYTTEIQKLPARFSPKAVEHRRH